MINKEAYLDAIGIIQNGTILNNLIYGMESYTQEQVERAVEHEKLKDYIESLPDKYHTQVGERRKIIWRSKTTLGYSSGNDKKSRNFIVR